MLGGNSSPTLGYCQGDAPQSQAENPHLLFPGLLLPWGPQKELFPLQPFSGVLSTHGLPCQAGLSQRTGITPVKPVKSVAAFPSVVR